MVLLSDRHFYRTLSLIQPFTEQSVVLNTGDAVKTKSTPMAIGGSKNLALPVHCFILSI